MRVRADISLLVQEAGAIVRRVTRDPSFRVRLFGSRAAGTARRRSDVDLGIDGPRPVLPLEMAAIRDACDRLPTLLTLDLVDLAAASPSFRAAVRRQWNTLGAR